RKRQIRRMCELVGLKVVGLKRVRIGHLRLGNLPEGKWRFLEPDETRF
ncbi:MAG TPA: pseudouridylate synthase, partial [Blastocatellia bacterium]|nr:pseudouridylate synthase [Blastocatellia bacterium]